MRCQHCSRNYGCDEAVEANKTKATGTKEADDAKDEDKATDANKADEAKATEADKADKANEADSPDKAVDATEADKANATEANEADEAKADDTNEANKPMIQRGRQVDKADDTIAANNADEAGNASESFVADEAYVVDVIVAADEAIVINTANLAIEANKANFAKAKELLANSIAIVLYSLTKYSAILAEVKAYFGIFVFNTQLVGMVWSCLRSLKCQHLQRADIEDGKLLSSSMRVRLCFVLSLRM